MSEKRVGEISSAQLRDAIDIIASAERSRTPDAGESALVGLEPAGAQLSPFAHLAPQGMDAVVDQAMGPVELPTLLDLKDAVSQIKSGFIAAPEIAVEVSSTVLAVLDEELMKIDRYIELREQ